MSFSLTLAMIASLTRFSPGDYAKKARVRSPASRRASSRSRRKSDLPRAHRLRGAAGEDEDDEGGDQKGDRRPAHGGEHLAHDQQSADIGADRLADIDAGGVERDRG